MEKNTTKKNNRKRSLIRLSVSAMLIGISVVVGALCREYLTFGVFVRITFENLPIILCGVLFGPVYGLCAGLCTDLVSSVATAQDINPIITLGAASVGFVSGAVMAVASSHIEKLEATGADLRYTSPLLMGDMSQACVVALYGNLMYVRVADSALRFADVVEVATDADILYYLGAIDKVYHIYNIAD
jgi:ECF transporter S component (folate family)